MRYGDKVRKLLKAIDRNQAELARFVGTTDNKVSRGLGANAAIPPLDQAALAAKYLGVSLDFLADDTLDEPPATTVGALSEDERYILRVYRDSGLSADQLPSALVAYGRELERNKIKTDGSHATTGRVHDVPKTDHRSQSPHGQNPDHRRESSR